MKNLKRILVPIDPTIYAQAATETACQIAKVHGAKVSGIAVLDSAEIRSSLVPAVGPYYPGVMSEVVAMTHHADHILKESLERFASTCESSGVDHLETEYEGIPARKLLESAIFYDLIVVGLKTAFHFETRNESFEALDSLLDRTITPILGVPAGGLEEPLRVLVTIDGSTGSARALHDFVQFAQPYDCEVKVIVADKAESESGFLIKNSVDYLKAHGFSKVSAESFDKDILMAVEAEIDSGANLVVAGIHSKKRLKDIFVGSFTRSLINRGDVAMFLSH
ncbi:MAG: universal stress protein [Verrucomicrobiales bacterium]|nr:universal stress protein [Verrucomicrobiales bacterium]